MHVQHRASLIPVGLAGLALACTDPAGPDRTARDDLSPALAKDFPVDGRTLQMKVEYGIQEAGEETIRELVEITSYFIGVDPIDPGTGVPVENFTLRFTTITMGYKEQREDGTLEGSVSFAWEPSKKDDSFEFEATDSEEVLDAIKLQVFVSGQAVADVTEYIAEVAGRIRFDSNLKLWKLTLGFRGIVTPSDIVTPSMLKMIAGATVASLRIDQTELTTQIRENEATYPSAELVLQAETKIQDEGDDSQREVLALFASFSSSELQPDPLSPVLEDLLVEFAINFPALGLVQVLFILDGGDFVPGDGGGVQGEEPIWRSEKITMLLVQDGQVLADLTDGIDGFEASLRHLPALKSWELNLDIDGIITPTDVQPSLFAPTAAARTAIVQVGDGLEVFGARLRESHVLF